MAAGALALGEGVAAAFPQAVALWPILLVLATLSVFFGYGHNLRGWPWLAIAFLGAAVFYHATVEREQFFRESPWMRNAKVHERASRDKSPFKRELSRRIGIGLAHSPEAADLNRAIILGERQVLAGARRRTFVDSGTIHIFAISGLHVMIIAKLIMFFIALVKTPLRWQGALAMPLVWAYVGMIGFTPSAVRAASMATVYFAAPLFWRRPDGLVAWAVTFLLVHLINPMQITNVGSAFSFVVMLSLVIANRLARDWDNGMRKSLLLTGAAWAAGVPIAAAVFGRVTPGGIIANFALMIAVGYSVVMGCLGVLTSFIWTPLAVLFNNMAALATNLMTFFSDCISRLPGASIVVPRWGFWTCLLWYLAMVLTFYLIWMVKERRRTEI